MVGLNCALARGRVMLHFKEALVDLLFIMLYHFKFLSAICSFLFDLVVDRTNDSDEYAVVNHGLSRLGQNLVRALLIFQLGILFLRRQP